MKLLSAPLIMIDASASSASEDNLEAMALWLIITVSVFALGLTDKDMFKFNLTFQ
jgi:hypothetical protein